ncbi:MAG TPA: hypothetical protein ENI11_00530 [Actinobacteria bacterium]|nr:hypothetical protein [Actinomycetota bacterium]
MNIGSRNSKFGWLWLGLFLIVGVVIEVTLVINKDYAANFSGVEGSVGFTRELVRGAHAHGNLLAIINILFGLFIGKAELSDGLKNKGSWLAIISAVLMPIGMFGLGFGFTPAGALTMLGAISMIVAVFIVGFGTQGTVKKAL